MYTYGWIILLWSRDYSTVYNRNDNPLQYSCLDNPMDKGAWRAIVHGVMKSQTQLKQLSTHTHTAAAAAAKSLQSCSTLCDPIDSSPPGSAIPGILQVKTLEWGAIAFSKLQG